MMAQETGFLKAYEVFQKICRFLQTASRDGLRLDEAERTMQAYLAEQGLAFLEEYVADAGDGDAGGTVTYQGRVLQRSEAPHHRRYVSIFGELEIPRYVYSAGKKKAIEYAPLDARLGLPAGEISYVLEDYQERLCVKSPFAKGAEDLNAILGTAVSVGTAERLNRQMAEYAHSYQLSALEEGKTPPPARLTRSASYRRRTLCAGRSASRRALRSCLTPQPWRRRPPASRRGIRHGTRAAGSCRSRFWGCCRT